ncbi:MAG: division/cell wall cluster transcriptional repressor MraZ [Candidatus Brocadiales bacterium]
MFSGNYRHVVDEKNRIAISSALRECVSEKRDGKGFYVTRGLEGCLFMFPPRLWDDFMTNNVKKLPFTSTRRNFERAFVAHAFRISCDPQGRIVIPQPLKEYAGLGRDVMLVGALDRIEIWDYAKWQAMDEDNTKNLDKLAEDLHKGVQ